MPTGIRVFQRIPPRVHVPVVVRHHPRIGHDRVRRQERAQGRVVVAGVVVEQARAIALLPRVRPVRLQVAAAAAYTPVGPVRAAGHLTAACVRGQRGAGQVVAVQIGQGRIHGLLHQAALKRTDDASPQPGFSRVSCARPAFQRRSVFMYSSPVPSCFCPVKVRSVDNLLGSPARRRP